MLSFCYSRYLKVFAALDRPFGEARQPVGEAGAQPSQALGFEAADALASRLGNRYRGIGVCVGLLSILIILCAVAPPALELAGWLEVALGVVKILGMGVMLVLVLYAARTGLRRRWIAARRQAEALRYQALADGIQRLKSRFAEPASQAELLGEAEDLKAQVRLHMGTGTGHCQIDYNRRKARQYAAVERMGNRLGWVGFVLALGAAVAHLFWHASWMLLLTVFVPALIGAIHGVNGFLKLEDLAEDHHAMAARLTQLAGELERASAADAVRVLELAELAYQLLTDRDVQWAETANRLGLKIA